MSTRQAVPLVGAVVVALASVILLFSGFSRAVSAQPATGAVTGQIVWRAAMPVPMPYAVPGQSEPSFSPDSSQEPGAEPSPSTGFGVAPGDGALGASGAASAGTVMAMPGPTGQADAALGVQAMPAPQVAIPIRPPYQRYIPAGAVLVAVQATSQSTRTDENGRFRIEGVPTGQYLTVAGGPVRGASTAFVIRPNVFIQDAGQTVDLGMLYLGQSYSYGALPYGAPDAASPETDPGQ